MTVTGIDYKVRHNRVLEMIGNGALLQIAMPEAVRNSDVHHNWRQESLLYWLTGFAEPESAILILGDKPEGQRIHLFLRQRDPKMEMWNGRRMGLEGAKEQLEIDFSHSFSDLWQLLPELLGISDKIFFDFGTSDTNDLSFIKAVNKHRQMSVKKFSGERLAIHDGAWISGRLRICKDEQELERMRKAADITAKGFEQVYKIVVPGMNEKQVHATLLATYLTNNADMEAYPAIVAGGENACILHYIENNAVLNDNELLLIDSGAQYEYYASDVTRTFPVGKKFTESQKALYEIVLNAELLAIDLVRVGNTWKQVHEKAVEVIVDGLLELGVMQGTKGEIIESGSYKEFFPHGTGHWLGMDVHDVGDYYTDGEVVPFAEGMVCTVEPGIYIPSDCAHVPKQFRGIGIRIEDDIVVTKGAPEVLTAAIPKSIEELESRR